jgi:hypothetical protein
MWVVQSGLYACTELPMPHQGRRQCSLTWRCFSRLRLVSTVWSVTPAQFTHCTAVMLLGHQQACLASPPELPGLMACRAERVSQVFDNAECYHSRRHQGCQERDHVYVVWITYAFSMCRRSRAHCNLLTASVWMAALMARRPPIPGRPDGTSLPRADTMPCQPGNGGNALSVG